MAKQRMQQKMQKYPKQIQKNTQMPKITKTFFKPCKTKQLTQMVSAASETVYISIVRGLMVQRGVVSYIRDSW